MEGGAYLTKILDLQYTTPIFEILKPGTLITVTCHFYILENSGEGGGVEFYFIFNANLRKKILRTWGYPFPFNVCMVVTDISRRWHDKGPLCAAQSQEFT